MRKRERMFKGHEKKKRTPGKAIKKPQGRKEKQEKEKKKNLSPKKVFLYALGIAVTGGAGYLIYDKVVKGGLLARKKQNEDDTDNIVINNNIPAGSSAVNSGTQSFFQKFTSSHDDEFPLKRGSRGYKVTLLQQGLSRIIGAAAMDANGGADGQFGPGTASALKIAGYPETVDEATFNKITGKSALQIVFNPQDLSQRLYKAADAKDIDTVLSILKQLKSAADYSSVNAYYKKIGFISKTIVTHLLDIAFKSDQIAKEEIKAEFIRIGLKTDEKGTWSLSGGFTFKDIITLRATVVTDSRNRKIPVKRNIILGDELARANGMTWFRSVDNEILKVPTQDVHRA